MMHSIGSSILPISNNNSLSRCVLHRPHLYICHHSIYVLRDERALSSHKDCQTHKLFKVWWRSKEVRARYKLKANNKQKKTTKTAANASSTQKI